MLALEFGDKDDRQEAVEEALRWDQAAWSTMRDVLGVIEPTDVMGRILEQVRYSQATLFDTPVGRRQTSARRQPLV